MTLLKVWENISYMLIMKTRGWSGGAKVSCILCHRGVQLILAYIWARPAILVVGKGGGGGGGGGDVFISSVSSLSLLFFFLPCSSLSSLLLSLFSLSLGDDTKWPTRVDVSLNPNTHKKKLWRPAWKSKQHDYDQPGTMLWDTFII